jgi:hypothetical protein
MYKDSIEMILSYPQRSQIKIDFDSKKQFFQFTIPIFSSVEGLPIKVKDYVVARRDLTFKPHSTSYHLRGNKVLLVQEVPFAIDSQSNLRSQTDQFWQLAVECHKMLSEISAEETIQNAVNFPCT